MCRPGKCLLKLAGGSENLLSRGLLGLSEPMGLREPIDSLDIEFCLDKTLECGSILLVVGLSSSRSLGVPDEAVNAAAANGETGATDAAANGVTDEVTNKPCTRERPCPSADNGER